MTARPCPSDFLPISSARRRRIEATIEALLAILDEADGDENIERDENNEPWLAGDAGFLDLEGDDSEDEPSLGWSTAFNQAVPDRFGRVDIVDGEEDAGELPEWDPADNGTADLDALALFQSGFVSAVPDGPDL